MSNKSGVFRAYRNSDGQGIHFEDYDEGTCHSIPIKRFCVGVGHDAVDGIVDLNEAFLVMLKNSDGNVEIEYSNDQYNQVKSILEELDVEFYSSIEEYNQTT